MAVLRHVPDYTLHRVEFYNWLLILLAHAARIYQLYSLKMVLHGLER